ncbi:unnamed protein product [Polarella glacialis]|uniref:Serine hydrolase domain-containing protein n=1 Tax=Polarella glacialis TaxID=89957 RepID=A0A813L106_POLGL|nr:unnamed protein product [Polarella glacialis]
MRKSRAAIFSGPHFLAHLLWPGRCFIVTLCAMFQVWEVVGGAENGGIIAREGKELKSSQLPERLATGALLKGLSLEGDRLNFERLSGAGPDSGWVSIKLKDKVLCQMKEPSDASQSCAEDQASGWKPPACKGRKPRVLCLHGTGCNGKIFKTQLAKLLPKAKDTLELIFLDGRMNVDKGPAFETMQKFFPGEPNFMYDIVSLDSKGWRVYNDPKATLIWLQAQLKLHSPIDGVLGFSQGANFALMLLAQAAASDSGSALPLGFGVLLGINAPGFTEQLPDIFTGALLPMPILVVHGLQEGYGAGMEPLFEAAKEQGLKVDTKGEDMPAAHVMKLLGHGEAIAHKEGHVPLPRDKQQAEEITSRIVSFVLESCS